MAKQKTNITGTSPAMEVFAQNLLAEKGISGVDSQTLKEIKLEIIERLEKLSNRVVLESLTDKELTEFERLIDSKAPAEDILNFTQEKIPDLSVRLSRAYNQFRLVYLGLA